MISSECVPYTVSSAIHMCSSFILGMYKDNNYTNDIYQLEQCSAIEHRKQIFVDEILLNILIVYLLGKQLMPIQIRNPEESFSYLFFHEDSLRCMSRKRPRKVQEKAHFSQEFPFSFSFFSQLFNLPLYITPREDSIYR